MRARSRRSDPGRTSKGKGPLVAGPFLTFVESLSLSSASSRGVRWFLPTAFTTGASSYLRSVLCALPYSLFRGGRRVGEFADSGSRSFPQDTFRTGAACLLERLAEREPPGPFGVPEALRSRPPFESRTTLGRCVPRGGHDPESEALQLDAFVTERRRSRLPLGLTRRSLHGPDVSESPAADHRVRPRPWLRCSGEGRQLRAHG
jgi:hypothetical protein